MAAAVHRPLSLAYIALHASDPERWAAFARDVLRARVDRQADGSVAVRFDEQLARVRLLPGEDGALAAVGWQCRDDEEWQALREQLESAGCRLQPADEAASLARGFERVAVGVDPMGHAIEMCCRPCVSPDVDLERSCAARLGHVVLGVSDLHAAEAFYTGALGLRITDRITFEKLGRTIELSFLRAADGRHHSLALVGGGAGVNHLMVELDGVDSVGHCLDRCRAHGHELRRELGRHSNDLMYSFYARSPNGVDVEIGCEGVVIDEERWQVKRYRTTSTWGHKLV